ncbi:hypothetical protein NC653_027068 [Populus alba x Populus x berolinensis]|uniref:Uncharacterized protein n=1 Tax=Populus alba x Populus x berolinensis TaxID=444605 RepID=A0AAD6M517_9ROSI|nr:hypothetical protein NC653_027068 [Populus alba x Populus x berolinensis]
MEFTLPKLELLDIIEDFLQNNTNDVNLDLLFLMFGCELHKLDVQKGKNKTNDREFGKLLN